jgi:hypothetical protein
MEPDVLVLGCGPAGLMAAQAARDAGAEVLVLSIRRKSQLYGCQYLHAPLGRYTPSEPVKVTYLLQGTASGYREKVYGAGFAGPVSPEVLGDEHLAWNLREAYDVLYHEWWAYIVDMPFRDGKTVGVVLDTLRKSNPEVTVVSTIPATVLCYNEQHSFRSQPIWAMGDSPQQKVPVPVVKLANTDNAVICNGDMDTGWYRASHVWGYGTVEWPYRHERRKPPLTGVALVQKPISTDCDCHPGVVRAGRYGKWQKGVLTHHAYEETYRLLAKTGVQGSLFDGSIYSE